MDLHVLETLVRDGLSGLDLEAKGLSDDGDHIVRVSDQTADPPRLLAVITDHRTDHFSLRVDGYVFHETEWPEAHQVSLVGNLVRILRAYLRGEGSNGQSKPPLGLGRVRQTYTIELDGRSWTGENRQ